MNRRDVPFAEAPEATSELRRARPGSAPSSQCNRRSEHTGRFRITRHPELAQDEIALAIKMQSLALSRGAVLNARFRSLDQDQE